MQENKNLISVSQLNEYIKAVFDSVPFFSGLYVRGEISNFKNHYTGHYYFTLKDEKSAIKVVMFRSDAQNLGFVPEDGMKVVVHGRVSAFVRDGVYQIYADDIQPDGVGALYFAYEQLKKKLEEEGIFDVSRKRPIPRFPKKIGIVTSPTGAVIRDMKNVLGRRWPAAEVFIYPAQVQGASAPGQLCAGIRYFNEKFRVDTIIIGRGGGSLEDLWAFNNETLARTVASSEIPVISAVGHETDFTICDFAADLRAPTPSAAAELAVPDRLEMKAKLNMLSGRCESALPRMLAERRRTIERLAGSRILSNPGRITADRRIELDGLLEQLGKAGERKISSLREGLNTRAARLEALSPLAVLARGYAVVSDAHGRAVTNASALSRGDSVNIRFRSGSARAVIENTNTEV